MVIDKYIKDFASYFKIDGDYVLAITAGVIVVLFLIREWPAQKYIDSIFLKRAKRFEADLKTETDTTLLLLKQKVDTASETFKTQLKKSEFLFQKEYEAASAFTAMVAINRKYSLPGDEDPEDLYSSYVAHLDKIREDLEGYLRTHGAILFEPERKLIDEAIVLISRNSHNSMDEAHSANTYAVVEKVLNIFEVVESRLILVVRQQSSV